MGIAVDGQKITAETLNKFVRGGDNSRTNLTTLGATITNLTTTYTLTNVIGSVAFNTTVTRNGAGDISVAFSGNVTWNANYFVAATVQRQQYLVTRIEAKAAAGFDIIIQEADGTAFDDTTLSLTLHILVVAYS